MKTFDAKQIIEIDNIKARLEKEISGLTIEKLFELEQELYYEQSKKQVLQILANENDNRENFSFVAQY